MSARRLAQLSGVMEINGRGEAQGDKWPKAISRDLMRRSVEFSVVKYNEKFDTDEKAMDKYRNIRASILPE